MNLYVRILLGYGYLVALLVLGAAGAALGFHQLDADLGRVLSDSAESVRAASRMLAALDRQEAALRAHFLGGEGKGQELRNADAVFQRALEEAGDATREVGVRFEAFRGARDRLLAEPPEHPLELYESRLFPRLRELREEVFALLESNYRTVISTDETTRRTARRRAILLALLVTVALLSLGFLSRALRRDLLDRLAELADVARGIAAGDRRRRATVGRDDELGAVARLLNVALDTEQATAREMRGRLAGERQLLLALLATHPEPAAVLTLAGNLVASTFGDEVEDEALRSAGAELRSRRPKSGSVPTEPVSLPTDPGNLQAHPLVAPGDRFVGWLVRVG
jgi:HAMP domain-containing protein